MGKLFGCHGWLPVAVAMLLVSGVSGCSGIGEMFAVQDSSSGGAVSQADGVAAAGSGRQVVEVELDPFSAGGGGVGQGRVVVEALEEAETVEREPGDGVLAADADAAGAGEVEFLESGPDVEPAPEGLQEDVIVALGDAVEVVAEEGLWTKDGPEAVGTVPDEPEVVLPDEPVAEPGVEEVPEVAVVEEAAVEEEPAGDVALAVAPVQEEIVEGPPVVACGGVFGLHDLYGRAVDPENELDGVWRIEAGETVAAVIRGWAGPFGWRIADKASVEWRVGHSAACRGSWMGAVSYLVDAMSQAVPAPVVTLYGGNRVVVLEDDGSVNNPF